MRMLGEDVNYGASEGKPQVQRDVITDGHEYGYGSRVNSPSLLSNLSNCKCEKLFPKSKRSVE